MRTKCAVYDERNVCVPRKNSEPSWWLHAERLHPLRIEYSVASLRIHDQASIRTARVLRFMGLAMNKRRSICIHKSLWRIAGEAPICSKTVGRECREGGSRHWRQMCGVVTAQLLVRCCPSLRCVGSLNAGPPVSGDCHADEWLGNGCQTQMRARGKRMPRRSKHPRVLTSLCMGYRLETFVAVDHDHRRTFLQRRSDAKTERMPVIC